MYNTCTDFLNLNSLHRGYSPLDLILPQPHNVIIKIILNPEQI